ncbi:uncharacterized protein LOC109609252 [Aethina tumida]|uniref:uncharacterized protein LOC109609252 n=1 Tax=Aethina tumida TaxID=116153 RepID=UPI00096AE89A|nr:uncharacterized protein LOC109609252 [Aethina tumida]
MISQIFTILLVVSATFAKQVVVQNKANSILQVSVTGQDDITLLPKTIVNLELDSTWSGSISACNDVCDGPRSSAVLNLGTDQDQYAVSLVDGFNLPIKVIPINSKGCNAAVCGANINKLCPAENQVVNSLGVVRACKNSPLLFQSLCPKAVVTLGDQLDVQTCNALSYKVILG